MDVGSLSLGGSLSPVSKVKRLFTGGAKGVWFDPSDFGTMFQDSAGTTPVTAVGQPVGKWLDKSGNGNHATQATAANRPTLGQDASGRYYLAFNGSNMFMVTGSINFTATNKMSVFAGVRKLSDAAQGMVTELSAIIDSNPGSFALFAPANNTSATYRSASLGAGVTPAAGHGVTSTATFAAPVSNILSSTHDIFGDRTTLRVSQIAQTDATLDKGTGNFGNYPLYIGMRGGTSLPFNGYLYGLIVRGALSSAAEIASAEAYVNSKTGAY